MKRVLIFIGLKIVEIVGASIIIFILNKLGYVFFLIVDSPINEGFFYTHIMYVMGGAVMCTVSVAVFFILTHAIPAWIKHNWKKAEEWSERRKK